MSPHQNVLENQMSQVPRKSEPTDPFAGFSESERAALERAGAGDSRAPRDPGELMARAYAKSGIDPLQAAELRDPNRIIAKVQGPLFAIGGLLLAGVGLWRVWNAWSNSYISIGGIIMVVIGMIGLVGGLAGSIYTDE
jgi:hypothetical protein